ncbi:hypothetical protein [Candidatus Velamenicoccus archaeovorus]|uniref:hypothetical protein n=1 Tax=Velamenicoccus archaeovorus TaxID=1930593 RepID=UPI000FFE4C2C|nr:hypothetical protein [Candidatus Velamenicoccus archaeovorus]
MRKINPLDASAVRSSSKRRTTGGDLLKVDAERRRLPRPEGQGFGPVGRIKYEIDPHQRLVLTGGGLRQVLDGTFKISKDDELVYHVKRPVAKNEPQQVRCRGSWSLDAGHRLVFSLDKWSRHIAGGKLVLGAEVLSVSGHELVFTLNSRDRDGNEKITLLTFGGSWQVDTDSRLNFLVEKGSGRPDRLRFRGSWTLNGDHELEYCFSRAGRSPQTLKFKGSWVVSGRDRLTYCLAESNSADTSARIDLEASLEHAFSDRLVFVLGGAVQPWQKKLIFFGKWRFDKTHGFNFELTHKEGRLSRMAFGGYARLKNGVTAEVELTAPRGEPLGAAVTLSGKIGGGEAFLRLLKRSDGSAVFLGYGRRW